MDFSNKIARKRRNITAGSPTIPAIHIDPNSSTKSITANARRAFQITEILIFIFTTDSAYDKILEAIEAIRSTVEALPRPEPQERPAPIETTPFTLCADRAAYRAIRRSAQPYGQSMALLLLLRRRRGSFRA